MKRLLEVLLLVLVGFMIGRGTSDKCAAVKATPTALQGVAVDCYDASGNLVPNPFFEKFGGVQTACAPGQTAKLHQPKAK
jgi:hypothetical protein